MRIYMLMFVIVVVKCTDSQFLTISGNQQRKPSKTSSCDQSTKSSLVEHFFNIIFTEFHNNPPVCVCVQMCPDQPTYCYPNGCLKREEKNKKSEAALPVTRISENTKPIFFIDEKNDFMNDFLTKNYIDESKPAPPPIPLPAENSMAANLRPDPFKDRYKILFKYKKMPKVELKYNLGEQVKNMKSDVLKTENVDVSKTRWPMNKIDRRLGGQRMQNEPSVHKGASNSRYFMSMYPDKDISNYPPKYFKRELPNNTNNENDGVDIKAIYVVGKSDTENSAFSLEKLIDSLIESSFDNTSSTLSIDNITKDESIFSTPETTTIEYKTSNAPKTNLTDSHNETTNIISMNFTNENVDKNKYIDDFVNSNNTNSFSEMIATLSKRIDIQNNTSLEMMRRITGVLEVDTMNTTVDKPIELSMNTPSKSSTTETTVAHVDYETKTTRKSRQRLVRRLQNSKYN